MVGEYFFSPCDDGVHNFAVFGDLARGVEISEPSKRLVGPVEVVGLLDPVELLESVPRGTETWMSIEELVEVRLVGVCEMIGPAQESEACSEQIRLKGWGTPIWVTALYLPPREREALGEPADDVEPIQHMASIW